MMRDWWMTAAVVIGVLLVWVAGNILGFATGLLR